MRKNYLISPLTTFGSMSLNKDAENRKKAGTGRYISDKMVCDMMFNEAFRIESTLRNLLHGAEKKKSDTNAACRTIRDYQSCWWYNRTKLREAQ